MFCRRLIVTGVILNLSTSVPCLAQGWTAGLTFGQSVNTTQDFDEGDNPTLRANTTVGLTARNETPTRTIVASTSFRVVLQDDDNGDRDIVSVPIPGVNLSLSGRRPRTRYSLGLSIDPEFVSSRRFQNILVEDEETGEFITERVSSTEDPLEIDIRATGSINHSIDGRNSVSLTGSIQRREYDETSDDFQPTTRISLSGGWNTALSPTRNAGLTTQLRYFTADDSDTEDSIGLTTTARYGFRPTPRHDVNTSAGLTLLDNGDDITPSFTGSASLAYRLRQSTYRIAVSQDIRQEDDGDIDNVLSLRGNVSRRLTRRTSLNLGAFASLSAPIEETFGDDGSLNYGFNTSLSVELAERWRLAVGGGLRFEQDNTDDSIDSQGQAFISVNRSFNLLP
jgi:hypothetical protein